ncbi:MAG: hypothetical protein QOH41_1118 [Blastocatellia bacterium]|nr:hypothetical protein [Blastocatellia bacterium]
MLKEKEIVETAPAMSIAERLAFMELRLEARRRILIEQAKNAARLYEEEQATRERELWQGGDIVES